MTQKKPAPGVPPRKKLPPSTKKKPTPAQRKYHLAQKAASRQRARETALTRDQKPIVQKYLLLGDIAEYLNSIFGEGTVAYWTPFDWYKRHRAGTLSVPLPTPVQVVGRAPLFERTDIKRWYEHYLDEKGRWG